jgi:predicted NBD/HSP70 family sugar kinase
MLGREANLRNSASGQGSNSGHVRQFNERVILAWLRRLGTASKADLARHANLTANTAGQIVQELEAAGLIRGDSKRQGERGQPATILRLDPEGAYAIGVNIGRRSVDTILVDFSGQVIEQRRRERPFPLPEEAVAMVVEDVAAVRDAPSRPTGPRVSPAWASPRPTTWAAGGASWTSPPRRCTPGTTSTSPPGSPPLAAETGLPTLVENDGTAAAVAELFQGRGRELNNFLYVFIGSAIGGGVVINGDYHRGAHGNAGDIGLMPTSASRLATTPEASGRPEILLTRASINALIRHLRGSGVSVGTGEELDLAIVAHPELVDEWLEDCANALVGPLLSAACVLDVEAVVLDGDLPQTLLHSLIERLHRLVTAAVPEARAAPPIAIGRIGRQAAAIGAAILPLHFNFSPSRDVLLGHGRLDT